MSGTQIDSLCRDWLRENYGETMASEYTTYSLLIPMWNSPEINNALENMQTELTLSFGPEQTFRATDYYEAREKLGLHDDRTPIPNVFVRAFIRN